MMQINQEASVSIQARPRWNETGIDLYKGQSYLLKASGEWCDWRSTLGLSVRSTGDPLPGGIDLAFEVDPTRDHER